MRPQGEASGRTGHWTADRLGALAQRIRDSPEVVGLHSGAVGEVAAHLPGHRVPGLRLLADDRVEVHVVMSIHSTVDRVEAAVLEAAHEDRSLVDLVIADVADPDAIEPDEPHRGADPGDEAEPGATARSG